MADKTITYKGNETVLPEKPMSLGNGLKNMPVTAAEQVVVDFTTDKRLPEYIEEAVKDDIYKANLAKESSIAVGNAAIQLTIPAGKYMIIATVDGSGEGMAWLTYNSSTLPSASSYEYASVGARGSVVKVLEFTNQTTIYLYNFTSGAKTYNAATSIVAVKIK